MNSGQDVISITTPALEADRVDIPRRIDHRRAAGALRKFDRKERRFDRRRREIRAFHEAEPTDASGSTENIADSAVGTGPSRSMGSTAPRS